MHLTNYSINKFSKKFVGEKNAYDNIITHKRSVKEVYEELKSEGHDVD